jgi:hypothetical protein
LEHAVIIKSEVLAVGHGSIRHCLRWSVGRYCLGLDKDVRVNPSAFGNARSLVILKKPLPDNMLADSIEVIS